MVWMVLDELEQLKRHIFDFPSKQVTVEIHEQNESQGYSYLQALVKNQYQM